MEPNVNRNCLACAFPFWNDLTADEVAQLPIGTMEVRYITACMEGEELRICKKAIDGGWLLGARRSDGKCAAVASVLLK